MHNKEREELELAREVQQRTYPAFIPRVEGFEIFARTTPASLNNGDFYEAIGVKPRESEKGFIFDRSEQVGHLVLALGDATGHGMASALMATELRAMLRAGIRLGVYHRELFAVLNDQLCEDLSSGRFITTLCGRLEAEAKMFRWVSFGQSPIWIYRAASDSVEACDTHRPPLGILPVLDGYAPTETILEPGDVFLALSDGFPETMNAEGSILGDEPLKEFFRANAAQHPERIHEALWQGVESHAGGLPQKDDRTFLFIRRRMEATK